MSLSDLMAVYVTAQAQHRQNYLGTLKEWIRAISEDLEEFPKVVQDENQDVEEQCTTTFIFKNPNHQQSVTMRNYMVL